MRQLGRIMAATTLAVPAGLLAGGTLGVVLSGISHITTSRKFRGSP